MEKMNEEGILYLNEMETRQAGATDVKSCTDTMSRVMELVRIGDYRMAGKYADSHGAKVLFPDSSPFPEMPLRAPERRFVAMPAYLGGPFDIAGVKWYGSNVSNAKLGLPRSNHLIVLNDKTTGIPFCIMAGNLISANRTAAVTGGLGARFLAPPRCSSIAIVGPGNINRVILKAVLSELAGISLIRICGRSLSSRSLRSFENYVRRTFPGVSVVCTSSIKEALDGADIASICVTSNYGEENYPMIKTEWVKPGAALFMSSNVKVEEDALTSGRARPIADDYKIYKSWSTEYDFPTHDSLGIIGMYFQDLVTEGKLDAADIVSIGDIITGKSAARKSDDQIIFYSVGGMPVEDVAWGKCVYENAVQSGIGTRLQYWG